MSTQWALPRPHPCPSKPIPPVPPAQTPGDYFKSEMEKHPDTYDTESFCDYILSQNAYETSDGSTIKLPNIYDYVYEGDDGKIYAGNTADQPAGSTRLYAK